MTEPVEQEDVKQEAEVHVRVLLFSVLREKIGHAHLDVTLRRAPFTGEGLLHHLEQIHPVLSPYRPTVRLAVNLVYAPPSVSLHDGDEVALITPVSGG